MSFKRLSSATWRQCFATAREAVLRRRYASSQHGTTALENIPEHEIARAKDYCSSLLRQYDSPSFTLQTFVPAYARDAYLAIRAFNLDVSRVADATSNPTVGVMRMQFWKDAVTKALAGSPPKEPVAILIAKAAEDLQRRTDGSARFSKSWFMRVIDTRAKYLGNPPYPDLASLESYAENTYSTLLYLTLQSLPMASVTADHVASHIGKAQGIAAILRGLPLIAFPPPPKKHSNQEAFGGSGGPRGAVMLPLDVMADAGVSEEAVFRQGANAQGLRDAVFTVATRASDHLITAREMLKNLKSGQGEGHEFEHQNEEEHMYAGYGDGSRQGDGYQDVKRAFGVYMPAISTQMWLDQLQKVDFDVFSEKLRTTDWRLPMKAYWAFTRENL